VKYEKHKTYQHPYVIFLQTEYSLITSLGLKPQLKDERATIVGQSVTPDLAHVYHRGQTQALTILVSKTDPSVSIS
jgi:hypothetical protein